MIRVKNHHIPATIRVEMALERKKHISMVKLSLQRRWEECVGVKSSQQKDCRVGEKDEKEEWSWVKSSQQSLSLYLKVLLTGLTLGRRIEVLISMQNHKAT